jgi:hypothetical protein
LDKTSQNDFYGRKNSLLNNYFGSTHYTEELRDMLKTIIKWISLLLAIEFILFVSMIATSMTDERPPAIGHIFYWVLKYIFGFPLVYLNKDYPYFLDSQHMPVGALFLIILNNLILVLSFIGITKIYKRLRNTERMKQL